jgi:hypothetical protein
MKMFSDLEKWQAVSFGDAIVLCISGTVEVNGKTIKSSGWGNENITIPSNAEIYSINDLGKEVVKYVRDDGEEMSVEDFKAAHAKRDEYYDAYEDEYEYPSIEVEFECRKELAALRLFEPVYRNLGVEKTKIVPDVVGSLEDTGHPCIETPIIFGSVSWSGRGIYKCDLSGAAAKKYKELASFYADKARFENATHSNIRYAKVDGDYLFPDRSPFSEKNVIYTDSLGDAKTKINEAEEEVMRVVVGKMEPSKLDTKSSGEFLRMIENLERQASGLSVKQRSSTTRRGMLASISNIKKFLIAAIDNQR